MPLFSRQGLGKATQSKPAAKRNRLNATKNFHDHFSLTTTGRKVWRTSQLNQVCVGCAAVSWSIDVRLRANRLLLLLLLQKWLLLS